MSEARFQIKDGKLLVSDEAKVAASEKCCCGDVCRDCSGTQNPVVVTAIGACAGASGTYTQTDWWDGPNYCWWHWEGPDGWGLDLIYCKASRTFCIDLDQAGQQPFRSFTYNGGGCPCASGPHYRGFPGLALHCVSGKLVGQAQWIAAGTGTPCDGGQATVTWA
jgi:hypothetical protein